MTQDHGTSPDGDRAVVNGAASVSALRASVPSAGGALTNLDPANYRDLRAIVAAANAASGFSCELVERPMRPGEHWCSYSDRTYSRAFASGQLDHYWHLVGDFRHGCHSAFWRAFDEARDAQP